jgi:hypothetical protein
VSAPAFALVAGLVYTALGFAGFTGFMPRPWTVNALHLVIGFWGLFSWSGATSAVSFARDIAGVLAVVALVALYATLYAPLELFPVRGPLGALYGATALLAAYFGFRSLARRTHSAERRHRAKDRRSGARPVAYERRTGAHDRRQAGFGGSTLAAG